MQSAALQSARRATAGPHSCRGGRRARALSAPRAPAKAHADGGAGGGGEEPKPKAGGGGLAGAAFAAMEKLGLSTGPISLSFQSDTPELGPIGMSLGQDAPPRALEPPSENGDEQPAVRLNSLTSKEWEAKFLTKGAPCSHFLILFS